MSAPKELPFEVGKGERQIKKQIQKHGLSDGDECHEEKSSKGTRSNGVFV